jgi:hypothetical protein
MGYVIISKLVAIHLEPIGWAYKESPDDIYDSGWRIFSGKESQDYIDNANNMEILDISAIIPPTSARIK